MLLAQVISVRAPLIISVVNFKVYSVEYSEISFILAYIVFVLKLFVTILMVTPRKPGL